MKNDQTCYKIFNDMTKTEARSKNYIARTTIIPIIDLRKNNDEKYEKN